MFKGTGCWGAKVIGAAFACPFSKLSGGMCLMDIVESKLLESIDFWSSPVGLFWYVFTLHLALLYCCLQVKGV